MHLSFSNTKSRGYNHLTKQFYKRFWSELKEQVINPISERKLHNLSLHKID